MANEMEKPRSAADLYRALGDDVEIARPILTGDVFVDVDVIDADGSRRRMAVMILDHPCSLRSDGVNLVPRLTTAEVTSVAEAGPWRGAYNRMHLPELRLGNDRDRRHSAAFFDQCYQVSPAQPEAAHRIACLSTLGINLLLQRRVHHFSRVVVPTSKFQEVNEGVYEEADIVEEWCWLREEDHVKTLDAAAECMSWLREVNDGVRRQDLLKDQQQRSSVRQQMREKIKRLRSSEVEGAARGGPEGA
jgi:hypothetical protein